MYLPWSFMRSTSFNTFVPIEVLPGVGKRVTFGISTPTVVRVWHKKYNKEQ